MEENRNHNRTICRRLKMGQDLLLEIKKIAKEEHLKAAIVLSAVGCVTKARLRDASGVNIQEINENCEIVSLMGTVSELRTHLHISLSKEDLSTIGGHLKEGCIIHTTCELVLLEQDAYVYGMEQDQETGYDEIVFYKNEEIMKWAEALCSYAGENKEFCLEFQKRLMNSPEIYEEFAYYYNKHDFLCKKKINGLSLIDIMIWQMDHFKSDMDRGLYDMQNNPDKMLLMAFDTFLKMEADPDTYSNKYSSDTGTDYPGKY